MLKKVKLFPVILLVVCTVIFSGCTSPSTPEPAETAKNTPVEGQQAAKGEYTIGISLPAADHGWMGALIANAKAEAEKHTNVKYLLYTAKDPAKQTSDIEDLITKKVDAVVMLPMESAALTPAAEKLAKANIPLIVLDRAVNTESYRTYVGGDNYGIGYGDAKYLVEELTKKKGKAEGKVVEISGVPSTVTDLRSKGFRDYIKDYPGVQIIATQPGDFTREKSLKAMENILQANKEIDAVYSQDDDMTIGIVQAIRDAKREKDMFIVSSGGMKEVYQMMKEKSLPEVIVSLTYSPTMGGTGVNMAVKILQNEGLDGFWEKSVPHHIILEATPITPANVDQYLKADANY
ncbi:substrate-binding domain-containing protein [Paenibacillus macquariensis]|uniref:Monosaccharide ABC transporter substrate-binding protein, CUT2 family n=1 Tax=Paenibacillus macquariensis TaxID=948756 RepID=A0ABY1K7V2_9BACL|nr:substrate-binding domain-containing protein [Paenibacillus macquariensis]MEC0091166.1 substrate-binding domain-containing protein [Paenibacillus macquariensis]OAB33651.1 LacI family transcriptional regulator [Paenibacillus macquariensis subsp. macquariensis]SIR38476.1 monosaccharide ABC transporter substrate-binding protein, CUT2 family [Paenibacillus macquariensis]